ncbi:MAG: SPOR domain-containing protein [candidate division Zixibacteria bacterium]|nr:SPOR domain-containing protein [candidate division Zixibacteria bacterium]
MKRCLLICLLVVAPLEARGDDIYVLIQEGRLQEARDSLSRLSTASLRDGNVLFFRSLLERDAVKSARSMEAALKASVDPVYQEETYYRLAQYYFVRGDYTHLSEIVSEYRTLWEDGQYAPQMRRFSIAVDEELKAYESAIRQIDRFLLSHTDDTRRQWGLIDKARIMLAFDKRIGAVELLRSLSREKSGPGVAQALYLLGRDAISRKRTDDAVFYYNILREGYRSAVGLDALAEMMADMAAADSRDDSAEKLTGTYYTVQVGVFSQNDNAKKQAEIFRGYEKKIDIQDKTIAGKTYRVVYVGRFQNYDEAHDFKNLLEANHHETYQVVAQ